MEKKVPTRKKKESFEFEYNKWLSNPSVRLMEKHQRADYMDLLCYVANEDGKGIKDDDASLMKLLNCSSEDLAVIKLRFKSEGGYLFNKKLSEMMVETVSKKKEPTNIFNMPDGLSFDQQIKFKKNKFVEDLSKFMSDHKEKAYSRDMLNDFYLYWTAPTHDKKKIKMELEKTWDLEARLNNWSKIDKNNTSPESKTGKLIAASNNAEERMKNLNNNTTINGIAGKQAPRIG